MTKLRILHVVTYMGLGGLETMIMNYYRRIDKEKLQFDFLTHREEEAYYDKEIKALGGNIYHLPKLNPFSLSYKKALKNFFLSHPEYKIVHVHQDCLSSIILKAAKECGVTVRIAHSHNSSQDKNLKYLLKLYYKRFIPEYATHLLACGEKAGKWMFSGAKFDILNNAIEVDKYTFSPQKRDEIRKELNISDNTLVVGHVGRFSEAKNHTFLLKIFNEICKNKDALLLLAGDGELRQDIEAQAKQLGIYDKVAFLGRRNDVYSLMQAMDVFVFPSLYEGFPVSVIEAQAAGLPCLISDGIPPESVLTDLVKILPLTASENIWANETFNLLKEIKKYDTSEKIKACGYAEK